MVSSICNRGKGITFKEGLTVLIKNDKFNFLGEEKEILSLLQPVVLYQLNLIVFWSIIFSLEGYGLRLIKIQIKLLDKKCIGIRYSL